MYAAAACCLHFTLHVGPKIKGKAKFDEYCVFANHVALDHSQVKRLKEVAKEKPKRRVYVCTIQGAHIDKGKAKMVCTSACSFYA